MPPTAVLFDIDGTLVDSNFLHVEAWSAGFAELDMFVPTWRIQRGIGADAAELLDQLLRDESDAVRERAKDLHDEHYRAMVPRLRAFPGTRELLDELAARGLRSVLATSAPQHELDELLRVLRVDDVVAAVTSAEDVETAKPAPDIIGEALRKGGVAAGEAVMVGDSIWDMIAAGRAGVRAVGVRSGGTGDDELRQAGALAVYDDVADLREHLDDVLEPGA